MGTADAVVKSEGNGQEWDAGGERPASAGWFSVTQRRDYDPRMTAPSPGLTLDLDRRDRCGFPEVIFGEGKTPAAVAAAVQTLQDASQAVLVTRVSEEQQAAVADRGLLHNPTARTLRSKTDRKSVGDVVVATAGTGDVPVAEEAAETLRWMGVGCEVVCDIGVAGPRRLLDRVPRLQRADAIVCVAGMEGALPSVLAGWVAVPVIAVPTSIGYGASFDGLAALLGMLNSCAANVTCVNIDAGFKAGYVAGLIATGSRRRD